MQSERIVSVPVLIIIGESINVLYSKRSPHNIMHRDGILQYQSMLQCNVDKSRDLQSISNPLYRCRFNAARSISKQSDQGLQKLGFCWASHDCEIIIKQEALNRFYITIPGQIGQVTTIRWHRTAHLSSPRLSGISAKCHCDSIINGHQTRCSTRKISRHLAFWRVNVHQFQCAPASNLTASGQISDRLLALKKTR